eukprot:3872267-Prymnesium_polylepis.1
MKSIDEANVGDTLSKATNPQPALPGFRRPQPMVFAGLFPMDGDGFEGLQHAMARFRLKDGARPPALLGLRRPNMEDGALTCRRDPDTQSP